MKEFFKSYGDLCKTNLNWTKEHWKGYTLICVLAFAIPFCGLYIYNKLDDHKSTKELSGCTENE